MSRLDLNKGQYALNLSDTYTLEQGLELPALHDIKHDQTTRKSTTEHVINIPITPRDDGYQESQSPAVPLDQEKRHKKKKKKKHREKKSEQAAIIHHDSDASNVTYNLSSGYHVSSGDIPESPPGLRSRDSAVSYRPVIQDVAPETQVQGFRRRKFSGRKHDESRQSIIVNGESKSKTLRKRKSKNAEDRELGVQLAKSELTEYIRENFKQYTEDRAGQDEVDYRLPQSDAVISSAGAFPSIHRSPKTGDDRTRAFGRINFRSDKKSTYEPPYVCIKDTDEKDNLINLMFEHWKLKDPKLIVSIVGGAKRFQFSKNRISSLFKQGLLDVATTTGAWILTPGTNTGVYMMVGAAVKDHIDSTGSAAMNDIVLLGIASWGSVTERDRLEHEEGEGKFPAFYPITEMKGQRGTQPLDPNHSHFILIDDSSREKFGGEIKWRAEFEKFLSQHVIESDITSMEEEPATDTQTATQPENTPESDTSRSEGEKVHIPLVTLLVNGGDGSLEAVSESLSNGSAIVSIVGSGRAAQVVILIHQYIHKHNQQPSEGDLKRIYKQAMDVEVKEKILNCLSNIAHHCKLVSVFDFIQTGINSDDNGLDRAILSALYRKDDMDLSKRKAQLKLALAWNRVDYARDEIFNLNNPDLKALIQEKEFLYEVAIEALLNDKHDFVALLIDHELDLSKFVTPERLKMLYRKAMQRDEAYSRFVKNLYAGQEASHSSERDGCCSGMNRVVPSKCYLHTIGRLFKGLLGYSYPNIYKTGEHGIPVSGDLCKEDGTTCRFRDPAQHIFMWATVFNRMDLARMFWKYSDDHVAGAIVGAAILRGLAKKSNHQEGVDITAVYWSNSLLFEELANGILDLCWSKDRQYTSDMLVRVAPNWGKSTVLTMAYNAEMEEFLAQPACYTKLNKIWRGDIALRTPLVWIILFALLPVFSFMLKFVRKRDCDPRMDERQNDPVILSDLETDDIDDKSPVGYHPLISVTCGGQRENEISYFMSIYRAFRAPLVKCIHYMLFFLVFLTVYSLFLMTELRPYIDSNITSSDYCTGNGSRPAAPCCLGTLTAGVGCLEIVTYCCVLSMIIEEIRQMLFRDNRSMKYFKEKLKDWISDFWNKVDCASYTMFISALITRFTLKPDHFEVVYWLYSFTLVVYFIRFSQLFYVVEQLGPKIIMIKKMLVDVLFFLVILSLTLVAYGVIKQAILSPQANMDWDIINKVIYKPYFQMYGELFLDDYGEGNYRWILTGFYMIITNVLLLNLLIAMFSHTFDSVQEKAEILWKYNYYAVVYEQFDRPYLGLFGSVTQIFRIMRCCRDCSCCCSQCNSQTGSDFRRDLEPEQNKKISKFVKVCMEKFMNQKSREAQEDVNHKVSSTAKRLELVIEQLDDLREDVLKQATDENKPASPTASPMTSRPLSSSHSLSDAGSINSKLNQILSIMRQQQDD